MRNTLFLLSFVALLGLTLPAQAQLRQDAPAQQAPVKLYDQNTPSFTLNSLFSPEHFRMGHSYEMSFGSFGGNSASMGMYTNSMMWQFNQKLAARVDVAFAHSPFGGNALGESQGGRVFLRNAEVAYRPNENMQLHFSMRQSPYGSYMGGYGSPYGRYSPYGGSAFNASFSSGPRDLFWNDR